MTATPENHTRFHDTDIRYAPGTLPEDRYNTQTTILFSRYISSIVVPAELQVLLREDFMQVDGALPLIDKQPVQPRHVMVNPAGKEAFITTFRGMVNTRVTPAPGIPVTGVWIPRKDYQPLERQVTASMHRQGHRMPGKLLAAAAVEFPYVLRPQHEGGQPLDFPPPFREPLGIPPEEEVFQPLHGLGDPRLDGHTVRVTQAVYVDEDSHVTGRVGLVWGRHNDRTVRTVPEEINREIQANYAGEVYPALSALAVVQHIQR